MKLLAVFLLLASACSKGLPIDGKSAYEIHDPIQIEWLRSDVHAKETSFHEIESIGKLPANVRGDIRYWDERMLQVDAMPLPQKQLQVYLHAAQGDTPDLVRFHYHYDKLDLTVDESVNFMVVWVRNVKLPKQAEAERTAIIADVARRVLVMQSAGHEWTFGPEQPGVHPGEDGNFTTSPTTDPEKMSSWEERADGGVMNGVLYFMLFKKNPSRDGYHNASGWFGEDLTKKL
jgi:hypothetical protein